MGWNAAIFLAPPDLAHPPLYRIAHATIRNDDASSPLILGLKHADQTHLAQVLARMLAQALGRQQDLTVIPDLLSRIRATLPQARLNATERARNVRHAFAVTPNHRQKVSSTTINECASTLQSAGAAEIRVLTFARTI